MASKATGWIAGTADTWQTFAPLGFTHGDRFTVDSPTAGAGAQKPVYVVVGKT